MKVSDYISSSLTGNSSTPVRTHSFTHSNTDINLQTQRPPIISWPSLTGQCSHLCWGGTEWQFGPTDAEKKVHSLRILVLTRLSCCFSTNSSVPELWSRFLQVSWSFWWSPNLKLTFAQISCETLHSCDSHTVVTWLNQPESHDFNYEVLTLVQEHRINNDNNNNADNNYNNHHIFH